MQIHDNLVPNSLKTNIHQYVTLINSNVSPRLRTIPSKYKKLVLLSAFMVLMLFYSQTSHFDEHTAEIRGSIAEYFYQDDNFNVINNAQPSLLEHLTNSDVDHTHSKGNAVNGVVKGHIYSKSKEISQKFYTKIIKEMNSMKSQLPALKLVRNADNTGNAILSKEKLSSFLKMDPAYNEYLTYLHEKVYNSLPEAFPAGLYQGTGVVFIGGGYYSWLTLLAIKSLRSFGSLLPIEVIIPNQGDYEHDFCEEILPALGASCIVLDQVLGPEIMNLVHFKGYQLKSLALIASSFDNTLLMDSDNIIVHGPDHFFSEEPYLSHGMVLWPDYWKRTTSPHFYEIANITVNDTLRVRNEKWDLLTPQLLSFNESKKVNYHDFEGTLPDVSNESGQLLIRKSDHVKTILMSFYYNLHGPSFFYKLISQGNTGEGDKDTFIAAAVKSKESFYQVKSSIHTFGWHSPNAFHGVCMGQKNPVEDYEQYLIYMNELREEQAEIDRANNPVEEKPSSSWVDWWSPGSEEAKPKAKGEEEEDDDDEKDEPPKKKVEKKKPQFNRDNKVHTFTVHSNFPKLNPLALLKGNKLKDNGKPIRMYGDISRILFNNGYDFEFVQFRRMKFLLCELNISMKYFNSISRHELCGYIDEHLKFLEDTTPVKSLKEENDAYKKKEQEKVDAELKAQQEKDKKKSG